MKFKVSRTSMYDDEISPCEGAFQEKYTYVEVRTLNSPEAFDERFSKEEGLWLSNGVNHCINERGYIQREHPNYGDGWFIEINSLEELLNFYRKYGKFVLRKCWDNPNINEIEIYDEYREM